MDLLTTERLFFQYARKRAVTLPPGLALAACGSIGLPKSWLIQPSARGRAPAMNSARSRTR